jgi:hypothetical protein
MILAARDAFTHEKGAVARYRKTADSGRMIEIVRCDICGVRLWHEPLSSQHLVFIVAGTLDDPGWAVPASHIWVERARSGAVFENDAVILNGQPDRQTLMDAFAKVYAEQ